MPRLVDGDNLLGTWRGRKRSAPERRNLAFELQRFARHERRRVVIVFDGPEPPGGSGKDVHYSGHGRSADARILSILREEKDVRGWIVVTDDRALGDQCRYLGARVERCGDFRRRLSRMGKGEKPEREDDVAYWLEVFGENGAEDEAES
ncbi:hypothetical protein ABI59_02225 [Acidobacteria bacterium Mor1]|nr:hypothetical protein ABI59_02225 [Acidobacteria bacterium Mor1]